MSIDTSIHGLFGTLKASLESAAAAAPTYADITPPPEGISLLDVKNELLLSYLHNLVFLILLKVRQRGAAAADPEEGTLNDDVVKQLVELRVYLEKGVRPLEGRLKYQIDKVLRAADDAARKESAPAQKTKPGKGPAAGIDTAASDSGDDEGTDADSEDADELSYRPNPAAMLKAGASAAANTPTARTSDRNGVYKPPRVAATAMPTGRPQQREERRPQRSAAVDEYISAELSAAPVAEPSIGSTIVSGGRRTKSDRERREEAERRDYEETNFVRLPKESKAERAKKGRGRDRDRDEEFGTSFGAGLDRIDRLTQKKGGRKGSKLDNSRKRAVDDGPRGDGLKAGSLFAKRRRLDTKGSRR